MTTRARALSLTALLAMLATGLSPAAQDVALLKDMQSVILLLGKPCDEVVSARRQANNDHIVSCRNGMLYRVFINPEGRLIAQKR